MFLSRQNIKSILGHSGPMFYYSHKSTLKNQYERKKQEKSKRRTTTILAEKNSMNDAPKLNPNRSSGFLPRYPSNQNNSISTGRFFPTNYRQSFLQDFHHTNSLVY